MVNPTGEVKRVADVVLARILDGAYPSGLRIPSETALAHELSCGRSTLREALRYLADLGLVKSRRGSGAVVLDYRREGMPALLPAYLMRAKLDAPPSAVARELLHLRALMAAEAVRLAARYARRDGLARSKELLAAAPALESDPTAHALNELELYRSFIAASGIWPATWMVNAFWTPLAELNAMLAPAAGQVPPGFQSAMTALVGRIEAGDEDGAVDRVRRWFKAVDETLIGRIEAALANGSDDKSTRMP